MDSEFAKCLEESKEQIIQHYYLFKKKDELGRYDCIVHKGNYPVFEKMRNKEDCFFIHLAEIGDLSTHFKKRKTQRLVKNYNQFAKVYFYGNEGVVSFLNTEDTAIIIIINDEMELFVTEHQKGNNNALLNLFQDGHLKHEIKNMREVKF